MPRRVENPSNRPARDIVHDEIQAAWRRVDHYKAELAEARARIEELVAELDEITSECGKLGMAGGLMQARAEAAEARCESLVAEIVAWIRARSPYEWHDDNTVADAVERQFSAVTQEQKPRGQNAH